MELLADVNVSARVVARLRAAGIHIVRVPEIMDARSTDVEIIAEAVRRGATVISHDQDFTTILAVSGATKPSLINVRVSHADSERLAGQLEAVVAKEADELRSGAIVTIDDGGVRVHRLPVG
ncbi:MAG: DUF5615 family PIN-like protein [Myxococcales bacterium]|nr:DUF5615 family PIN-like protein [Myxococcales bacterium]